MQDLVPVRRALISVSDKTGLLPLAEALARRRIEIVSTGGTAAALAEAGIAVIRVEDVTGCAEMMGGRVKTLHPAIHGAVLARRDEETDRRALADQGISPIDLVCVNLYPFEQTIRRQDVTPVEALEQIDIGGPTLLRSAAKNHRFVAVVSAPDQYEALLVELKGHDGATTLEFRRRLAEAAFRRTAAYDTMIGSWMTSGAPQAALTLSYAWQAELRYGENPHQPAALYVDPGDPGPSVPRARVLHGKALSYNNIQDAAAALELVQDLDMVGGCPCCAIIKHTNPCGAGAADSQVQACALAYECDPLAAYGGILAVNRPLDEATAAHIANEQKFLEVIVAPDFELAAIETLGNRWKNVRLLAVGTLRRAADPHEVTYRSIPGGMLVQQRDAATADPRTWQHVAGPEPTESMTADAAFAWTIVKHLKSNAVALARGGQMIGAGCGQVDRVSACRLAIEKAGDRLGRGRSAVAASDAFFPFPDGPRLLIDAGIKCIIHPGGSKRDQETLDLCDEFSVTCLHTGVRHFRH